MRGRWLNRRKLLVGSAECAVAGVIAAGVPRAARGGGVDEFGRLKPGREDRVRVPRGYAANVILRWGDPLFVDAPGLDADAVASGALLEPGAATRQAQQFGFNCDGIGLFELAQDRVVLCINHEYPIPQLMFPGWAEARAARALGEFIEANSSCVPVMQASVGLSVVELDRKNGWRLQIGSALNRRITAHTAVQFTGPAADHPLLGATPGGNATGVGTLGNCAGGVTPWGTFLTAEENVDDFFGHGEQAVFSAEAERAHRRFGYRRFDSAHRWEYADPRFDLGRNPNELLKFGWITEVDPLDPSRAIKKRTALGRLKHEAATSVLTTDRRAAVYMGDDEEFEYLYKFVSAGRVDAGNREANLDLLDRGTLHVARFDADGSGEWLPLVWSPAGPLSPSTGFASQADVVLHCREAADCLGATPLDRPEDVAVNPLSKRVYVSCTQNVNRGGNRTRRPDRVVDSGVDAANPRGPNRAGHLLELSENGGDAAATSFRWQVFILAGDPVITNLETNLEHWEQLQLTHESTYFAGFADAGEISAFANPDNLTFDARGNLWIVTDGAQPKGNNNGCFVCATAGEYRGQVAQFMSGPVGAEICGCEITADDRALFLSIQHPGDRGSTKSPRSRWPDGGRAAPRPSVIVVEPRLADRRLGEASDPSA